GFSTCVLLLAIVLVVEPASSAFRLPLAPAAPAGISHAATDFGRLPLQFEANEGEADAAAKFLAHGPGYNVFLTPGEALLALSAPRPGQPSAVVSLEFAGAADEPLLVGEDRLPGVVNYYLGRDPARWHTGIPTYRQVRYQGLYPGVDLLFFGNQRQLEHDFVLAPGADPGVITLRVKGTDTLAIDPTGDLVLGVAGSELRLLKPTIYQEVDGHRLPIDGGYLLKGGEQFGFQVAAYDGGRPLIIDPVLSYSTTLGGSGDDYGYDVALDAAGNVYVTGKTNSTDFPLMNPSQPGFGGGGVDCPSDEVPYRLCYDAFVTKIDASGTTLAYSTYIGLPGDDEGYGIAVDPAGNAYFTGLISLNSDSLPDMYIYKYVQLARLDPLGAVTYWISFGSVSSKGLAIAVDAAGRAYLTGEVASSGFPTTPDAIQTEWGELIDAFVAVIDTTANELVYSTYLGGSGEYCDLCYSSGKGIAVDGAGLIYVTGQAAASFPTTPNAYQRTIDGLWKAFVAKIDPTRAGMEGLVYSTFLGGTTLSDFGHDLALGADGTVYVTGATQTDAFPTTPGAFDRTCGTDGICNTTDNMVCDYVLPGQLPICHVDVKSDVFVARLDTSQSGAASLLYSTYVGGGGHESGYGIAVDPAGNATVTGKTVSPNFPLVDPIQGAIGGNIDAFAFRLNAAGSALDYATFLGGGGDDVGEGVAVDTSGSATLAGWTGSMAFPTVNPLQPRAGGWEAFVARIDQGGEPASAFRVLLPIAIR
ncbi:MAG: hypothetical protein EHM56_02250, partial [Chloroflexi bacterium]